MRKNIATFVFASILLMTNCSITHARSTINWPYFSYPPMFIVDGDHLTGYGIDVINVLIRNMPEYAHRFKPAAPSRIFADLKSGENSCAYGVTKTPDREKYVRFSRPARLVISDMVAIRKSDLERLTEQSHVSLKKLLQDKNLVMGTVADASFGNRLDEIIRNYGKKSQVESLTGTNTINSLTKMLLNHRIDWFIWDPASLLLIADKLKIADKIVVVPIKETREFGVLGYIACPKNAWGTKVVEKVDRILKNEVQTDAFYEIFTPWVPANLRAEYRRHYLKLMH